MKSSVIIDWEKKEGGITGSHEKVKFVEQAPLEAGWASENMVVLFCCLVFFKSSYLNQLAGGI